MTKSFACFVWYVLEVHNTNAL